MGDRRRFYEIRYMNGNTFIYFFLCKLIQLTSGWEAKCWSMGESKQMRMASDGLLPPRPARPVCVCFCWLFVCFVVVVIVCVFEFGVGWLVGEKVRGTRRRR